MVKKAWLITVAMALAVGLTGCDRGGVGRIRIEIWDNAATPIASTQPDASTGVELEKGTFLAGLVLHVEVQRPGIKIVPAESPRPGLPIGTIEVTENCWLHKAEPIEIDPTLVPFVRRNDVRRLNDGWDVEQRIIVTRPVKLVRASAPTPR